MRAERGWVGLLALLIALALVAVLAQTVLKRYGLLPGEQARAATKERSGSAADAGAAVSSTPAYNAPIERAKGVEATVLKGASEMNKQVEDQTR